MLGQPAAAHRAGWKVAAHRAVWKTAAYSTSGVEQGIPVGEATFRRWNGLYWNGLLQAAPAPAEQMHSVHMQAQGMQHMHIRTTHAIYTTQVGKTMQDASNRVYNPAAIAPTGAASGACGIKYTKCL